MTGTGSAQGVSLTQEQVEALGDGVVTISATQVDQHGNVQEVAASTASFTLDTIDPSIAEGDDKVDAQGAGEDDVVVDADVGASTITVTAIFDEDMDTAVIPTVILTPDVETTLTEVDSGAWDVDGRTLRLATQYRMAMLMRLVLM